VHSAPEKIGIEGGCLLDPDNGIMSLLQRHMQVGDMKRLILEIINDGDYFKPAEYVILDLNEELIGEIKELSEKVRRCGALESEIFLSCIAANADYDAEPDNGKVALKKYDG
jgi:hypothetical protein